MSEEVSFAPAWPVKCLGTDAWLEAVEGSAAQAILQYLDGADRSAAERWLLKGRTGGMRNRTATAIRNMAQLRSARWLFESMRSPIMWHAYEDPQEVHRLESLLPDSGWPDPREWQLSRV